MVRFPFATLAFLLLPLSLSSAQGGAAGPAGSTELPNGVGKLEVSSSLPCSMPFAYVNGLITVKAALSGGSFVDAAIGTALPICVVSPEVVSKQALRPEGVCEVPTLFGTARGMGLNSQLLRVGRVVMSDVPFGVIDLLGRLSARQNPDPPALWLGTSALAATVMRIDPLSQQIAFLPTNTPVPKKCTKVPFELRKGCIYVDVKVNDKSTMSAMVDTSAVGTLIPESVAKALKITGSDLVAVTPEGKNCHLQATELTELALGAAKIKDVQAVFVSGKETGGVDPEQAIIGTDVLFRYKVTIDYPHRLLILEELPKPTAQPNDQPPAQRPSANPSQPGRFPGKPPGLP